MTETILILAVILPAVSVALRSGERESLISRRPYNNPYSDASGARDGRY
ncbi:MAG: hypothetical protein KGJ43_06380 [Acidobacteriota bacterium]|nr:hypothetical protein [Acidobacteriota bacterium]